VLQSDKAIITPIGKSNALRDFYTVDVQDYQSLKEIEDRASDALLCLDSTTDTVTTLVDVYRNYSRTQVIQKDSGVPYSHPKFEYDEVLAALKEKEKQLKYARKKTEALLSKTQNTRALVRCRQRSDVRCLLLPFRSHPC
jgi:hypothetical protein